MQVTTVEMNASLFTSIFNEGLSIGDWYVFQGLPEGAKLIGIELIGDKLNCRFEIPQGREYTEIRYVNREFIYKAIKALLLKAAIEEEESKNENK